MRKATINSAKSKKDANLSEIIAEIVQNAETQSFITNTDCTD